MAIELRPMGVACNIACQYCYQNTLRDAVEATPKFDFNAVTAALEEADQPFNLFGGEPLLLPLGELDRLLSFNQHRFGTGGIIQTNGVLVTPDHIELFTRHGAMVSISIDGPGPLNDARWAGSLKRTRTATEKTLAAIDALLDAGLCLGVMVQITRSNGVGGRLARLCQWLEELDRKGVPSARVHVLELDGTAAREAHGLSVAENVLAIQAIVDAAATFRTLRLDVASDRREMLLMEDDHVACAFRACDPLFTESVNGLGGHGEPHKCGLTDKEGIDFLRTDTPSHERYLALYQTPQRHGGCKGCRFFVVCKGQCPGAAIQGDWRNRSDSCETWRQLFAIEEVRLELDGYTPISRHPRRIEVEQALVNGWVQGENINLHIIKTRLGLMLDSPL